MGDRAALRVFISYRREDTAGYAGWLHDSLSSRLPDAEIFMDVGDIEPGADFTRAIADAVGSCHAMLALIGARWATPRSQTGGRRLDDPDDYLVAEIGAALERDIRVIPVLVEGTPMPEAEVLPERLRALSRRNAIGLATAGWSSDVEGILAALRRLPPRSEGRPDTTEAGTGGPLAATGAPPGRHRGLRQPWLWPAIVTAVVLVIAGTAFLGGGSDDETRSGDTRVVIEPRSGPAGSVIHVSAPACPPLRDGRRPEAIVTGLSRPGGVDTDEIVPLIPGRSWSGELRTSTGMAPGPAWVYAICFAVAPDDPKETWQIYHEYLPAEFEVAPS